MKYVVNNHTKGQQIFETEAEAQSLLAAAQAEALISEAARFCVAFVEVSGTDTTWRAMLDSDLAEGDFKVFVHDTGLYESYTTRSLADARILELHNEFLVSIKLDKVYEYVAPRMQPKSAIGEIQFIPLVTTEIL